MSAEPTLTIDGNEAAARVAYLTNEVIAIYPITPASPMGEWADEWAARDQPNLWGQVPEVIEMQSEAGAAGVIHGALQAGSLATSFTASQGLLLMIPNMYKIAGELSSTVLHVAARSLATQALSIFGDHSDVMACRSTGWAMLCSSSVQEVMDFAMIAQAATIEGRVPFLHFFDGFRTSHEINKIAPIDADIARGMLDEDMIAAHREVAMTPDKPVIRGTSQNPDVYFQGRESVNLYYRKLPFVVQRCMDRLAALTGRQYRLFEYHGHKQAERVIVLMGSGLGAAAEAIDELIERGERVGLIKVRLYRPFDQGALISVLPSSVTKIAVLDRTKEPGADGEPLYKDVVTAIMDAWTRGDYPGEALPRVVGGRYGLGSKEFTPAMVAAVFAELENETPKNHFSIGIHDDLTKLSLPWDERFQVEQAGFQNCVFFGLGSDGTVSANKNGIKIIGEQTGLQVQGYFQYDSKKAGAITVSHLRFGPRPIRGSYLIGKDQAQLVACHQPNFLDRYDMLVLAAPHGRFLLNSHLPPEQVWHDLPREMQQQILDKRLSLHVIDAYGIAERTGMGRRINTIMQVAFFALNDLLPFDRAIELVKQRVEKSYGRKGRRLLERNFAAIDAACEGLHQVPIPNMLSSGHARQASLPANAPDFVRKITASLIAGQGDQLPVSAIPADGTWPTGTAAYEKSQLALQLPKWEADLCTHCGKCPLVCPHAAIRSKLFPADLAEQAPDGFLHVQIKGKDYPRDHHIAYQVAPDDCTGCGLCVAICPIRDKQNPQRKALNMVPVAEIAEQERGNWDFFLGLPEYDRTRIKVNTLKGSMLMQPLFEFSSACVGCGETPYIKLATQLFGDRMLIANATGCSSIYGGNLPTTPYTQNPDGRGPSWNNSLFEDNAEFGLGMRIAVDQHREQARRLVRELSADLGEQLAGALLEADQSDEAGIHEQRERVRLLRERLAQRDDDQALALSRQADYLVKKSVWLIGGDGWAYDIGFGGVDHVLASGRDVNILVLDTEVYSNTGGQTSKATPLGAVAKFSAAGKSAVKKDLAMHAMAYGDCYVAQVAFGAKDVVTLKAFLEAESYPGPSLIIAYSPCIAHGVDLSHNLRQQDLAVNSGHWPLFRYDPRRAEQGEAPLHLDSKAPSISYREFANTETRFSMLSRTHPEEAERFIKQAQQQVKDRFERYQQLAALSTSV